MSGLCYPDRRTVCFMLFVCDAEFVQVVCRSRCRLDYEL